LVHIKHSRVSSEHPKQLSVQLQGRSRPSAVPLMHNEDVFAGTEIVIPGSQGQSRNKLAED